MALRIGDRFSVTSSSGKKTVTEVWTLETMNPKTEQVSCAVERDGKTQVTRKKAHICELMAAAHNGSRLTRGGGSILRRCLP